MDIYNFLLIALIIDFIFADPDWYPHPVVLMGKVINYLEKKLIAVFNHKLRVRIMGLILAIIVIIGTYLITWQIIRVSSSINYYLGFTINIWLLFTTIAIKGLVQAGNGIYQAIINNSLKLARKRLSWIVGRDTDQLRESEIIRATIETLAENTSDGIIAPLFYALLGGAPAAMAYKAVNTLDSMLGYKNQRYLHFGWAAAKIDDLANWIPARITGALFIIAALINGYNWEKAFKTIKRDAKKHPSPNAGYPEAAIAGALGVRLGGVNFYHGEKSFRAYLGVAEVDFNLQQINRTIKLIYWNVGLFLGLYYVLRILIKSV